MVQVLRCRNDRLLHGGFSLLEMQWMLIDFADWFFLIGFERQAYVTDLLGTV